MTFGYARYAPECGVMQPHRHAEEICFVVDAADAWVCFGPDKDDLKERRDLSPGMTLHETPGVSVAADDLPHGVTLVQPC